MVLILLLLVLWGSRLADAVGPTCAQAPNLVCAASGVTDTQVPDILTLDLEASGKLLNLANNEMLVGTAANTGSYVLMPDGGALNGCAGPTDKPLWNKNSHQWSCGVDAGGGGAITGSGTDKAITRWLGTSVVQGSLCILDDTGGIDCQAPTLTGGALTLKEGQNQGANTVMFKVPDATGLTANKVHTFLPDGNLQASSIESSGTSNKCAQFDVGGVLIPALTVCAPILTAGAGIDLTGNAIATASQESFFLADGGAIPLICGAGNQGQAQVMDSGPIQYCDGAATSTPRYTAIGEADGTVPSNGVDEITDISDSIKTGTGGSFLVASATENPTTGGCAQWASGLLTSTGAACGSGGGITNIGGCTGPTCFTTATQNTVFAGPISGGAVAPTFRVLNGADMPNGTTSNTWAIDTDNLTTEPLNNAGLIFNAASGGSVNLFWNTANDWLSLTGGPTGITGLNTSYLYLTEPAGVDYVQLLAPAIPTPWSMTLPPNPGTAGYYLQTNGAGVTTWQPGGTGTAMGIFASATVCAGTSSGNATATSEIAAATTAGKAYLMPSGCRIGLGSPALDNSMCTGAGAPLTCCTGATAGTCHAAVIIPNNAKIYCQDSSAGFFNQRQRTTGGTYPGAACNTDAEAIAAGGGAGTCDNDFGTPNVTPCDNTTCFAPTAGQTYTMLRDAGGAMTSIEMYNCTLWAYQADPYQRCVGGGVGTDGDPCRQECTGGSLPGFRCEVNGDCFGGGTCTRVADCHTPGGTCSGAPHSLVGAGDVIPIEFGRTPNVVLQNVKIRDHFAGSDTIRASAYARLTDVDAAAETTDCTSPLTTPVDSLCFSTQAGNCCYGSPGFGTFGVQPTTSNVDGIHVGDGSTLVRVKARGATNAINSGINTLVDRATVQPGTTGPGTPGGGIVVYDNSVVRASRLPAMKSGGTGISITNGAEARDNNISGQWAVGILMSGTHPLADGNRIDGANIAGVGISAPTGDIPIITNNRIWSNPDDTLAYGIKLGDAGHATLHANTIRRIKESAFWFNGAASFVTLTDNMITLTTAEPTAALKPVMTIDESTGFMRTYIGNTWTGGWRGYTLGPGRTASLINSIFQNNRVSLHWGAPIVAGGTGIQVLNNYFNGGGHSLSCDATCTGNRGGLCKRDSDCTGCSSTFACIPEAIVGYIGSPTLNVGSQHNVWSGNVMVDGGGETIKQCGGTGAISPGARCTTTAVTGCTAPATCTGGSEPLRTCVGTGVDNGKLCCTGGGAQTCAVRTATPMLRFVEYATGLGQQMNDTIITNNWGAPASDSIWLDMASSGSIGTADINEGIITGNLVTGGAGSTNTAGIRWPTVATSVRDIGFQGNTFVGLTNDFLNPKGTYGNQSFPVASYSLQGDMTTAVTNFADICPGTCTGANPLALAFQPNRNYYFNCELTFSSSVATTGIGFAVSTGAAAPTTLSYVTRLPTLTVASGAGTDNMTEEEGILNDGTQSTSIGVGTAGVKYTGAVRGNLRSGATAGVLTARVKTENGFNVTVYQGSNCTLEQKP